MDKYLIIVFTIIFSSCMHTTVYKVEFNSFIDESYSIPTGSKLYIMENPESKNPIFDREITGKIIKILINEGYYIAPPNEADYCIIYNYGITSGKEVITQQRTEPGHYEQKSRVNAYNTTTGVEYKSYYDQYVPGKTSYVNRTITVFHRYLNVKVFKSIDLSKKNKKMRPVWVSETKSTGSSNDLRMVMDYLLVPTFKNFGINTGRTRIFKIYPNNKEMKVVH